MARARRAGPTCTTRFLAFYSDVDQLIVPARNARVAHPDLTADNVLVKGVGHLSLPINGRIVHETCARLALSAGFTGCDVGRVVHRVVHRGHRTRIRTPSDIRMNNPREPLTMSHLGYTQSDRLDGFPQVRAVTTRGVARWTWRGFPMLLPFRYARTFVP